MPDEPSVAGRHETASAPAPRFTGLEGGEDCRWCAAEREQARRLIALITEQRRALHAVLEYADGCKARPGAQLDALTVASALYGLLAGLNLAPRPCEACLARQEEMRRHAAFLTGLADLQKAAGA